MTSVYKRNRLRAQTTNTDPTLTEQSMAKDTDINIIVQKFRITGRVPGAQQTPIAGDFTNLPTDLREMIETSRDLKRRRAQLPPELREMPIEELLALTPDKLRETLKRAHTETNNVQLETTTTAPPPK